jgi:hypothetical protein
MLNLQNYVRFAPAVTFVGLLLVVAGQLASAHWVGKPLAFFGVGVALVGLLWRAMSS